ncbi:MAG: sodium ion-translocating decarboxylase subunit beta, partial [Clostridia bacterium]|nr:sodium ion-translocating decarboxylase subunit beta [Clostridia bacterium]
MLDSIIEFLGSTGVARLLGENDWWKCVIMYVISFVLIYLAIKKGFEPLLLLPIAIGMLLTNLPGANMFDMNLFINPDDPTAKLVIQDVIEKGGLLDFLYLGVKLGIYPSLIFIGIGAMTDFSPLIA